MLYFSDSSSFLFSPFSLSLLEFLKILTPPNFISSSLLEISGNHRFSWKVDSLGWVCKVVGLLLIIKLVLAQFPELRYMHQHIIRDC